MRGLWIGLAALSFAGAGFAADMATRGPSRPPVVKAVFQRDLIPRGYDRLGPTGPYFPARAAHNGVAGGAVIKCALTSDGALHDCLLEGDKPPGYGFGAAALVMASKGLIKADPRVVEGQPVAKEDVLVVVPFEPPTAYTVPDGELPAEWAKLPTRDAIFVRARVPDQEGGLGPAGGFFPERANRQNLSGSAVLHCTADLGRVAPRLRCLRCGAFRLWFSRVRAA